MDIQTKDGILLRGIPDGTPDDVIKARIEKIRAGGRDAAPASSPLPETPQNLRKPEEISAVDKLLIQLPDMPKWKQNVLTGATGVTRGALNLLPYKSDEGKGVGDIMAPAAPGSEGTTGRMIGSLLDPASWAVAGGVGKVLPFVPLMAKGASGIPLQLGRNVASGATTGGAIGALSDEGSAGTGTGGGAVAGAVLPPAIGGTARVVRALKEAAYPSPGRLGVKAAGDRSNEVINAMLGTQSGVPGVNLTAGQAAVPAGSAEFSALQKLVAEHDPSRFTTIKGQQEGARQAAVQTIGKTPSDLEAAVAARSAASEQNYGTAFKRAIKADPDLAVMSKNPYFEDALPDATKLAKANNIDPKANLTEFLHFVKVSLDKQLQKSGDTALGATEKRAVKDLQKQLVDWLTVKNPDYNAARLEHIRLSQPINQMKVGQEIEQALIAPATGAERAASFGTKVRQAENKISKSTGRPRIEDLTPAQRRVLDAIEQDFQRNAEFKDLASAGGKSLEARIGQPELPPTGMFQPMLSAARGWVNRALGTGHEAALQRLAPIMENPQEMARLMRAATPQQRAVIESMLARRMTQGAIVGGAAQGER